VLLEQSGGGRHKLVVIEVHLLVGVA
jgi:hypothetical protein